MKVKVASVLAFHRDNSSQYLSRPSPHPKDTAKSNLWVCAKQLPLWHVREQLDLGEVMLAHCSS